MDLSRVKSTKEKITIIQQDKYPDTPVLELIPQSDNKRWTIKINRNAYKTLGVKDDKNRLIVFDNYNISLTDTPDYQTVVGLVSDEWVQGPSKKHKSFQIHLNTRCIKSKNAYTIISSLNNDENVTSDEFELIPVEGLEGVYTLNRLPLTQCQKVEVEVNFDKGENIGIEGLYKIKNKNKK